MSEHTRIALLALVFAELLAAAFILLMLDRHTRRLRGRVEQLTGSAVAVPAPRRPVIVRPHPSGGRRRWIRMLLNMPDERLTNLPLSHSLVFMLGGAAGVAAATLALIYVPPWQALPAALLVGIGTVRMLFGWQVRRYALRLLQQMPDMIEMVVGAIRVGLPVGEALRSVAREMPSPTRDEFAQLCNEVAVGVPTDSAMRALYQRTGLTEYGILSMTFGVQTRSGGRLAETIQTLGETVRQRLTLASKARALAAEARLSAIALSVLPFIAAIGLSLLQPGYLSALLYEPSGRRMLTIGFVLLGTGILTMRWMIRRATEP
jgi:tight adherence protein B